MGQHNPLLPVMIRSELESRVIMNRPPERPPDEQWAVIKRTLEIGWRLTKLTPDQLAREAVIAYDSCADNDSKNSWYIEHSSLRHASGNNSSLIYKVNTFVA